MFLNLLNGSYLIINLKVSTPNYLNVKNKNYTVTIISYHYVRPIKKSKHPNLKGLSKQILKKQIKFLKKNLKF